MTGDKKSKIIFFSHYGLNVVGSMVNVGKNYLMFLFIDGVKSNIPPVVDRHFSKAGYELKGLIKIGK